MTRDTEDLTERAPSLDQNGRAAYRVAPNGRSPSTNVIEAVAEVADCDPLAGDCVLYDVIDPDALDRLFADRDAGTGLTAGKVVFSLQGCRIEACADGELVVHEPHDGHGESNTSAAWSA
jgi:hypothetical protein